MNYYDEEVLNVLEKVENPTCIALITGGGKSQSIMEFIRRNKNIKSLIIFSTKREQAIFKEELNDDFDFWNGDKGCKLSIDDVKNFNSFSITKQKFINMVLQNKTDFFSEFDYIFYDEFSTLNPCLTNDLIKDLSEIQRYTQKIYNKEDIKLYKSLEVIYSDIKNRMLDLVYIDDETKLFNRVFKLECDKSYIKEAEKIMENAGLLDDDKKTNIRISSSILLMLNSIIHNRLYASAYENDRNEIIYSILGVNDMIKTFISNYKGKFIVMDATADIVRDVYDYLNIEVYDDFTKNKNKTYEHVNFNIYEFKDVEPKLIRRGDENSLDKISQAIKDRKIVTFIPKKVKNSFKNNYGYEIEKIFHFFSGDDIGSNDFRDNTELNIIALQTYPRSNRVLYNHIIKGENLESANTSRNDFAEFELLSSHLVQNINRSKSRIYDCNDEININLICVPRHIALKASTFMKGSKVKYNTDIEFNKYSNITSRVLSCIEDHIKSYIYKEVIELDTFLIERKFFNTIDSMMNFINSNLLEINKLTLKLGFEFKIKEEIRPYIIKTKREDINDEKLKSYDNTRNKFLNGFIEIKREGLSDIKIKDFKKRFKIKDATYSITFKKYEEILKDYGVYKIGASLIFID